jgi:hypothetical protein
MAIQQGNTAPILFPTFSPLHSSDEAITQLELDRLISLRNRMAHLEEQIARDEAHLKSRLESGAAVEPGVHVASLKENSRRTVAWKDVVVRLAERLELDGMAYCANVLAHTKPTITRSLEIS